jgi:hypothetical protein
MSLNHLRKREEKRREEKKERKKVRKTYSQYSTGYRNVTSLFHGK